MSSNYNVLLMSDVVMIDPLLSLLGKWSPGLGVVSCMVAVCHSRGASPARVRACWGDGVLMSGRIVSLDLHMMKVTAMSSFILTRSLLAIHRP